MPWSKPTLRDLVERASEDLSARLLDGAPLRPQSTLSVLAITRAGGEHMMYGFLAWAFQQIFPDKAESEFLDDWAAVWGLKRKPPSASLGRVLVTGRPGSVLPEGALAQSPENISYRLAGLALPSEGDSSPGSADVTAETEAEAVEPGPLGNLPPGAQLQLISPVAGIRPEITVTADGLKGGADLEPDDDLRRRLLLRIQESPHGGAKADYVQWALEVPGVARAKCFPLYAGLGTVGVAVWGLPEAPVLPPELVARVHAHILERVPVTAGPGLYVYTPEILPVDILVKIVPDTPAVRHNVLAELADLFARSAEPGRVLPRSHLTEALSLSAGEYDHNLLAPLASISPTYYQLPALGEVLFVEVQG